MAVIIASIALLAVVGAIGDALSKPKHHHGSTADARPLQPEASVSATNTAPAAAPKPAVLARFHGTGIENTPQFMVHGTWRLEWSYNCASLGSSGNFIVNEDDSVASAVTVNELGNGGSGTTYGYDDSGRHYLAVNSECPWKMKVVGTR